MASHVIVIDSSYRRITIKTTPGKHLSDVLEEACSKLKLRPEQYGLKHNSKNLDLSVSMRQTNLPPGANLHLVQASRSASVISVALQLPASENNARLLDKFPSTTSFWQILRRFESGAAGNAASTPMSNLNFTQRGIPSVAQGQSGAGRLNYEMPVIQLMNREVASFEDLQKTLGQLGLNSGSALLRLSFRNSGRPLEEAMTDISKYFRAEEEQQPGQSEREPSNPAAAEASAESDAPQDNAESPVRLESQGTAMTEDMPPPEPAVSLTEISPNALSSTPADSPQDLPLNGSDHRPMTVFAAPSGPSPDDPRFEYNESDFEPTVDHAKQHQARLNTASRNKRLPSDKEIADAENAKAEKLAAVSEVRIRIRLPDQTSVEAVFTQQDSGADLYNWLRPMMLMEREPFALKYLSGKGQQETLPDDGRMKLVEDLKLQGRMLMSFAWDDKASMEARKKPALKEQYRQQAQQMKVHAPVVEEEDNHGSGVMSMLGMGQKKGGGGGGDKEAKLKKLLGFGKK